VKTPKVMLKSSLNWVFVSEVDFCAPLASLRNTPLRASGEHRLSVGCQLKGRARFINALFSRLIMFLRYYSLCLLAKGQ
jgi:hypothetical protein